VRRPTVLKSETYADLACGFRIGTSTVYRHVREALALLAAMGTHSPKRWKSGRSCARSDPARAGPPRSSPHVQTLMIANA
jgi:hypothetical protein